MGQKTEFSGGKQSTILVAAQKGVQFFNNFGSSIKKQEIFQQFW